MTNQQHNTNTAPAPFSNRLPCDLSEQTKPQLIVVIDTEEEFDWNAPADRNSTGVATMAQVHRVQNIFDEYGIKPCYTIDYPIASKPEAYQHLQPIHADGRCEIGTHLHPWVSPPYDEVMQPSNTYPGNLSPALEREKLSTLTQTIEENFGFRPTTYKAGRYGIGVNTPGILSELGYDIDLSVCPPVDYRADGGPDFRGNHAQPFWFDDKKQLLEIPVTGAYVGWLGSMRGMAYDVASRLPALKAVGILSKVKAVDRLMLSPEGFNTAEHKQLTRNLVARGVRTFTWSFHSPSVMPGYTPYVNSELELKQFLQMFRDFFEFFFNEIGGEASTPTQLKTRLEAQS